MFTFLRNNREALIERCAAAVARRPRRVATAEQLRNGIPMFLDQLTRTLEVEEGGGSSASLIGEAASSAALDAAARGCTMVVRPVDPSLWSNVRREPLVAAIVNLLQNGFKFTKPHTEVVLSAYAGENGAVCIDVADHCGGLPSDFSAIMFKPFSQADKDRSGLGLGLAIARQGVEAEGGTLGVRDVPGTGCVFTISLPSAADRRV